MVRMETTRQEVLTLGPVRSQYISFDETMYIRVSGMRPAQRCAPTATLEDSLARDQVEFWVRRTPFSGKIKQYLQHL